MTMADLHQHGVRKSVSLCAVKGFGFPGVTTPPGNWVAPAGSDRSVGGGNETVGAFETTDRQAVRRSGIAVEGFRSRPRIRS
jgi:hypothetical protein